MMDRTLFDRFYKVAVNPATYDLPRDFFNGADIVDVGCGNTAYFQKAMIDLGAKHVTCIDIENEWIEPLDGALQMLGVPREAYSLIPGSTTAIPAADNSFDFVASNGVIMHLDTVAEAEKAISELCRVCKPGGYVYVYVGVSKPAIMDKYLLPAMRQAYLNEPDFRDYIDNITPERVQSDLAEYIEVAAKNDPSVNTAAMAVFFKMFTLDTATFVQNALQVPRQLGPQLSPEWAAALFEKAGFENVRRAPSPYWVRNDIRKYLAPFHWARGKTITKLFYGDGHAKLIAQKPQ